MRHTRFSLCGAALAVATPLAGQAHAQPSTVVIEPATYTAKLWSAADGLPVDAVADVLVDDQGYLWVATLDGLAKFDGLRFTVVNRGTHPELPSNRIKQLALDPHGRLWFLSEQGDVGLFADGEFSRRTTPDERALGILKLVAGSDAMWGVAVTGFYRIDDTGVVRVPEVATGAVIVARSAAGGGAWVSSDLGLAHLAADGTIVRYGTDDGVPAADVTSICVTSRGEVWIASTSQVARLAEGRFVPVEVELVSQSGRVTGLYGAPGGGVWVTAPGGAELHRGGSLVAVSADMRPADGALGVVEGNSGEILTYQPDGSVNRDGEPWITAIKVTVAVRVSRDIYFGTEQGLLRVRPAEVATINKDHGLPDDNIYPILQDRDGDVWLGTWAGGLARFADGRATRPPASPAWNVSALYEDRGGHVWVATMGNICIVEPGLCREVSSGRSAILNTGARAFLEDRHGRFWIGTELGIVLGEPRPGTVSGDWARDPLGTRAWRRIDLDDGLRHRWVRAFLETRAGQILLSTNGGGLASYANGAFTWLDTDGGLASNQVRGLHEDAEGRLWVATEDAGLCRLELPLTAATTVACVDRTAGLFDNALHTVTEDGEGRVWLSSNRGVFWVDKTELNAVLDGRAEYLTPVGFTEEQGMPHREANGGMQPALLRHSDGTFWYPTQRGVAILDPSALDRPEPPRVTIETITLDGVLQGLAAENETLELDSRTRTLEIAWSAPPRDRPRDVRYRYRLVGYDDDWRYVDRNRGATFGGLPPGDFEFQVEAGIGGAWSVAGAGGGTVRVARTPTFRETAWFPIALVLGALGIALAAHQVQTARVRQRQSELEATVAERTSELRDKNTRIEQQAARLRELDELKARFVANISHELRTPLTLIRGPLFDEPLAEGASSFDPEHLEMMRRNADQLGGLVEQLLDVATLEAGAMSLVVRRLDLSGFLREVAGRFAPTAERQGVVLSVDTPGGPTVYVDADKLGKVMSNLLSNALKFTPKGCTVTVFAKAGSWPPGAGVGAEEGWVTVGVRDTGIGIAEDELDHVFDRFYQSDRGDDRQVEGTGIGLSLAREFVELHGGEITAESERGVGSTFRFTLPLGAGHLAPDEIDVSAASDGPAATGIAGTEQLTVPEYRDGLAEWEADLQRPLMLLVEDNSDMCAYLTSHFLPYYNVATAQNGVEALRYLGKTRPDVIVSDVMMPGIGGLELCRRVRNDDSLADLPIVLVSAKAGEDSRVEGLEVADDYVTKPFSMRELRSRVARLVDRRAGADRANSDDSAGTGRTDDEGAGAVINRLDAIVAANMERQDFGVASLAHESAMSVRTLQRRLQDALGETATDYLRRHRMEAARAMLQAGQPETTAEVAAAVGLSRSYFYRLYRSWWGHSPATDQPADASEPSSR